MYKRQGIGLQKIAQTDGSTSVRLLNLEAESLQSFVLPGAGDTKKALIQARSVIANNPQQQRTYKVPSGTEDRATTISNKWSAEVTVKDNVVADANGHYNADAGWVAVAVVDLNETGIETLTDLRVFYNLFDPDFFSVYGRKNLTITRPYDRVNLVEVPFEFSDLVPKLDQVSVRRITKERFGETITRSKFTSPNPQTHPCLLYTSPSPRD